MTGESHERWNIAAVWGSVQNEETSIILPMKKDAKLNMESVVSVFAISQELL